MPATEMWSLQSSIILFVLAGMIIGIVGTKLSRQADRLADLTGLGEAVTGAVLLGAATSLSGITRSLPVTYHLPHLLSSCQP